MPQPKNQFWKDTDYYADSQTGVGDFDFYRDQETDEVIGVHIYGIERIKKRSCMAAEDWRRMLIEEELAKIEE